ncbi:MAG: class I SAM-dependent methyltransferase [Candidatus Omnitrophica bacterium]|nr:class I SAM-dependent methyltransferase [Candidatus Omnitrophota bacterium]
MHNDYTVVTELPGMKASKEQIARLYQRYRFAHQFCGGKDVLEIGCGAGQGLGYLAETAERIIGGDIDENNLDYARKRYKGRGDIKIEILDAQKMPFNDEAFDVVILYEAIYYLSDAAKFIGEAYRVLKDKGSLIICSVNKDWPDFNPSPLGTKYFSVPELYSLLKTKFPDVSFYGGFSAETNKPKDMLVSLLKKTAVRLHIMPKTMRGKELLKRLFFGRLYPMPQEVKENMTEYTAPVPIPWDMPDRSHKVIFAIAHKKA